ncbi:MAG: serine hydrolase [Phenylobacterium sp.]|uniref:serine hydrolase n=1 Tax=Phenylobacterium sp. TaxID=1871053 RepID=UPI001A445D95|nr:serine hydrolase [Phenylobacterium sp.]MBL8771390.1 serine hydrolase [Phenylobacterium sp.]
MRRAGSTSAQPAITRRAFGAIALSSVLSMEESGVAMAKTPTSLAGRLKAELERAVREDDFSGSVLLSRGEKVVFAGSYGLAERGFGIPNQLDTRFNTASIPKLFTSLAVMRLVEAGKLRLDQSLNSAWPGYPNTDAGQATISQLLSHTAGFGNHHTWLPTYAGPPLLTNRDYFARFVDEPLVQAPGQGFSYSNNGYVVLGLLVERITGERYFDHLARTIWKPLGMVDTGPLRMDIAAPRMAHGYFRSPDLPGAWQSNLDPRTPVGAAHGGIFSTVADLDRFGAALARGDLLSPALMREWTTGRQAYHRGMYGLGCSEVVIDGKRIIGHSGGHDGVAGELMVWPQSGYRFSILSNTEPDGYFALVSFIKQLLTGADQISRVHDYSRALAQVFLTKGAEAARAMHAGQGPAIRPSEGLLDAQALREIHRGRSAAGLALLRFNVEVFAKSSWPRWSLAEALRRQGDSTGAVAAYRDYLALEPDDADAKRWLSILAGDPRA